MSSFEQQTSNLADLLAMRSLADISPIPLWYNGRIDRSLREA